MRGVELLPQTPAYGFPPAMSGQNAVDDGM